MERHDGRVVTTGGATAIRLVVLVRHAQAEGGDGDDHARRLTPRGLRDAAEAGLWLAGRVPVADLAWVSSATRAQQTWEAMTGSVDAGEVRVERALYQAGPQEVADVVGATQVPVVVVVGHNPTVEQVLAGLAGERRGMRPGAIALVDLDGARLVELWEPSR